MSAKRGSRVCNEVSFWRAHCWICTLTVMSRGAGTGQHQLVWTDLIHVLDHFCKFPSSWTSPLMVAIWPRWEYLPSFVDSMKQSTPFSKSHSQTLFPNPTMPVALEGGLSSYCINGPTVVPGRTHFFTVSQSKPAKTRVTSPPYMHLQNANSTQQTLQHPTNDTATKSLDRLSLPSPIFTESRSPLPIDTVLLDKADRTFQNAIQLLPWNPVCVSQGVSDWLTDSSLLQEYIEASFIASSPRLWSERDRCYRSDQGEIN